MTTEQKHTPEPWRRTPFRLYVEDARGRRLAIVQIGGSETVHEDHANAARIVACVNYCAGMTDDQLTCDSALIVREELDRVVAQRDRLLAAAEKMAAALPLPKSIGYPTYFARAELDELRTAIAECQP
jgi:hypothetical protein